MAQDRYLSVHVEDPRETRARLALVKTRLAAHGVRLPPGRLARFERLSEDFAAKTLSPALAGRPRDLAELLEGNRDFHEVAVIVEHLLPPAPPADPAVLSKLKLVLGGAPLPSEDANPLPRSTQFELYVAALCKRGGLAVKFREPDCVITVGGVRLGLAAKRAGGPGHVRRLFVDAASQLRRAGLVGVVALSLDRLFRPNDERLFSPSAEALKPEASRIIEATLRPHIPALDRAGASSPALALFAFVVVPVAVPRENRVGRVHSWTSTIQESGSQRSSRRRRKGSAPHASATSRPAVGSRRGLPSGGHMKAWHSSCSSVRCRSGA